MFINTHTALLFRKEHGDCNQMKDCVIMKERPPWQSESDVNTGINKRSDNIFQFELV